MLSLSLSLPGLTLSLLPSLTLYLSLSLSLRGGEHRALTLSLLLPQGMEGKLRPPAYWPPICCGALGRSESL